MRNQSDFLVIIPLRDLPGVMPGFLAAVIIPAVDDYIFSGATRKQPRPGFKKILIQLQKIFYP